MRIYGYIRVSTKEQNTDRQLKALINAGVEERMIFIDKVSGRTYDRPSYNNLKNILHKGDTVVIKELDRLGRTMDGIKKEYQYLIENGINITVLDNPMLSIDNTKSDLERKLIANIVLEILSYTAEKEIKVKKQRQAEGIASAKERGVKLGRPKAKMPNNFGTEYKKWKAGKQTAVKTMSILNLKKDLFYKFAKEYEKVNN